MKRIIICISFFLGITISNAQNVNVEINSGIYSQSIKSSIERNASALLSEINRAHRAGRPLNFHTMSIEEAAQSTLAMLWSAAPFYCEDSEIIESVMTLPGGGYQIRNIPLELTPSSVSDSDDTYQEAVIDFDRNGRIESFYFAISKHLYKNILRDGNVVGDFRRRQMILDYVEHFRTAYNQKDIDFLEQVFSNDALIITGKVIKTKPNDFNPIPQDKVIKVTQSKRQYLDRLGVVFRNNRLINVKFDDIEISQHPMKTDFYGVSLRQSYSSDTYNDDGYLFLLWDFTDENHPQIHVRVWEDLNHFINKGKYSIMDLDLTDM